MKLVERSFFRRVVDIKPIDVSEEKPALLSVRRNGLGGYTGYEIFATGTESARMNITDSDSSGKVINVVDMGFNKEQIENESKSLTVRNRRRPWRQLTLEVD